MAARPWLPSYDFRSLKHAPQTNLSISDKRAKRRGEYFSEVLPRLSCWFGIFDDASVTPTPGALQYTQEYLQREDQGCDPRRAIALGDLQLLQGCFEEAEMSFKRAISWSAADADRENRVTAQVKLGMLLENLGRLDEAELHLRAATGSGSDTHFGALKFLQLFLLDHGSAEEFRDLSAAVSTCPEFERWWSNSSSGHLLYDSPHGFMNDLEQAWYGDLRLGLIHKLVTGKLELAEQYLFEAHTSHATHWLLALHLRRVGEVMPVRPKQQPAKISTLLTDDQLVERVGLEERKSILKRQIEPRLSLHFVDGEWPCDLIADREMADMSQGIVLKIRARL